MKCFACKEEINVGATRCPYCTSERPQPSYDGEKFQKEVKSEERFIIIVYSFIFVLIWYFSNSLIYAVLVPACFYSFIKIANYLDWGMELVLLIVAIPLAYVFYLFKYT